jgi:hypothetical protein
VRAGDDEAAADPLTRTEQEYLKYHIPAGRHRGPYLAAELESGAADAELRNRQEQLDVVLFPGARGLPGFCGVAAGTGFDGEGGVGRVGARG